MAFPDTIIAQATVLGDNPPHKSDGGSFYYVAKAATGIDVYKSTNPGTSAWSVQDATANPTNTADFLSSIKGDDNKLHIVSFDDTNKILYYHRFDMGDDLWEQADNQVANLSGMTAPSYAEGWCVIAQRPGMTGDEIVIGAPGLADNDMGTDWQRFDVWRGPDSGTPSWTGPIAMDDGSVTNHYYPVHATNGLTNTDYVHFAFYQVPSVSGLKWSRYLSLTDSNTPDTEVLKHEHDSTNSQGNIFVLDDGTDKQLNTFYSSGGIVKYLTLRENPTTAEIYSAEDYFARISDATPGASIDTANTTGKLMAAVADSSDKRHVFWVSDTTDGENIWHDSRSVWDSADYWETDRKILDAVVKHVHVNVYTHDSKEVFGIIYDDNGTIKYTEYRPTAYLKPKDSNHVHAVDRAHASIRLNVEEVRVSKMNLSVLYAAGDGPTKALVSKMNLSVLTQVFSDQDAIHVHKTDKASIKHSLRISPKAADHLHTADTPTAQMLFIPVYGAAADHIHTAEKAALSQKHDVRLLGADHVHTVEPAHAAQNHIISAKQADHLHDAEPAHAEELQIPRIEESAHVHAVEPAAVSQKHSVGVKSAAHTHAVDPVHASQNHNQLIAESDHVQTTEPAAQSQKHSLKASDANHVHTAENCFAHLAVLPVYGAESVHLQTADVVSMQQNTAVGIIGADHLQEAETVDVDELRHARIVADIYRGGWKAA